MVNGTAQILGALLGAALSGPIALPLRAVFGVSAGLRILTAIALFALLPKEARRHHPDARPHRIVLRVIGFRANGGIALRPVRWLVAESKKSRSEEP
jgi:predicted MFS family arabinose efflux permease